MPALEPYIDAHSHIWTPDVAHYPLAKGFTVADMQPPLVHGRGAAGDLPARRRRPGQPDPDELLRVRQPYMLDMIKLYPDRFVGTAIVDPLGDDPGEAMRELLPTGRAGVPDPAGVQQAAAGALARAAGYAAMFATAAQTGQALSCLIDPDGFPEVDRMCRRFPDTTVIIDHLGRIGAAPTDRSATPTSRPLRLAEHPKVLVKVGAFYALGKKTPPYLDLAPLIRRVVQAFGPRRCMWESDCPFQVVAHRYDDSVALIRDRLDFLSKDDRDWLLVRTAEQTLFQPLKP